MNRRFTEKLREAHAGDWDNACTHRFVQELFNGSISNEVMARYLIQDHRFLESFLMLLGAAMASADNFEARLRFGRFAGMVSSSENTYFLRAFEALGVSGQRRDSDPDNRATAGFKALMQEAAQTRDYVATLSVLVVAEWLYQDWAARDLGSQSLPESFVHAEWIELHDNDLFNDFVAFLRTELDRLGPQQEKTANDFFGRAVALELDFFNCAYQP